MLGTTLLDRYRLEAVIGQGGMGTVFRAQDLVLDRAVAVKLLNETQLGTQGRNRLLHEARAAAQLNHPNIVSIYDAGEIAGVSFIVMELVPGRSLYEAWPLPPGAILDVARQICAALEHAHAHGIIHRDLKLENILVAEEAAGGPPLIKLTDFGLARSLASRLTQEGGLIGTVFYLAPEIALGQPADGRADLYSLGVLLYELTTGKLPFTGDDPLAVISQHLHAPLVPPHTHVPDLPPALEALICQLLAKQPDERPASAAAVRARLEQIGRGEAAPGPADPHRSLLDHLARGRLVGREREAAELRAHWTRAVGGAGHVLLLSGEPGIGKTRLVQELRALAEVSGGRVLAGECYAEGGAPYGPITQILRPILLDSPPAEVRAPAVLSGLLTLVPDLRPVLAPEPAARGGRSLEPQAEQSRVFESFVALCAALAAEQPLLLCIEDVHWADSGTLFLLRHLARRLRRQRLLLVFTYRETDLDQACCLPEVLVDLNRERLSTRLKLGRFSLDGTRALLAALLQGPVSDALAAAVHHETEGNPFFVEEVCKTLVEESRLSLAEGSWQAAGLDEIIIPQSVRVTLQARVAKLPEPAQDALRLAAVLGRDFDFETLARASDLDEEALIAALEAAEHAQLIVEARRTGQAAFSFAHALIPSALREGVSRLRRQRLHRRAGLAVEAVRPDDFEALAYHAEQAGDEDRARGFYLQAGRRALQVYANQEAERHLRAALDTLNAADPGQADERARALAGLGEALFRLGRYQAAHQAWQEAEALFRRAGQASPAARLWARMARAAWQADDPTRSLALCRQGLSVLGETPESDGLAYLIHETGRACYFNQIFPEARALCQRALDLGRRLALVEVQAEALATLGILPGEGPDAHYRYLTESVALAEAADLPATASRGLNNLANAARELGRPAQEIIDLLQRAREHNRRIGHVADELKFVCSLGLTRAQLGDLAGAAALRRESQDLAAQLPPSEGTLALFELADTFLRFVAGEFEAALSLAEAGEARARAQEQRDMIDEYATLRARIYNFQGDLPAAEAAARTALAAVGGGERSVGGYGVLALLLAEQGRRAEARAALDQARQERGPTPNQIFESLLATAEAALADTAGQAEAGWSQAEAALAELEQAGWRWSYAVLLLEAADVEAHSPLRDPERIRRRLQQARSRMEVLGLPRYVALVDQRLRALEPG